MYHAPGVPLLSSQTQLLETASSRFLVDDFTSRQPFTSCSEEEFYQLITQSAN